jgi:rifampicin phosphotransferase
MLLKNRNYDYWFINTNQHQPSSRGSGRVGPVGEYVLEFGETGSDDREIVGGKAASLGKLSAQGFPVPRGFTVRTEAYRVFLTASSLHDRLHQLIKALDYDGADDLERGTAEIRALIVRAELPREVADAIASKYRSLTGETSEVAVRSSGTAEDMAEASFAGLHDTYLHIVGVDEVLTAVRRCWASMWTARATAYRQKNGLDHLAASIAVVVQQMVNAEIAGVLFTANPLTTRVDELVINAAWGLGEGVVSGVLTPDEYRLATDTLSVRGKTLGTKSVKIVRDPDAAVGTVSQPVAAGDQNRWTLDDDQLAVLGDLGRRVEAFYEGIPQDIEWAYADGQFYLLQSRDITGVEFTWDEHVDVTTWPGRRDDPEIIWGNTWAEQFWTGAITPLFYSLRAGEEARNWARLEKVWDMTEFSGRPWFKYRRGTAYWNITSDEKFLTYVFPKALRPAALAVHMPPPLQASPAQVKWDALKFLKMQARVQVSEPEKGLFGWIGFEYDFINNRVAEASATAEELRQLSDAELRARAEKYFDLGDQFIDPLWSGFFIYGAGSMYVLGTLLATWYTGGNADVFQELITGLPTTRMAREQHSMWELAEEIRASQQLTQLLHATEPAEFFARLGETEDGKAFKAHYDEFLTEYGHRGHADRDIYYTRRIEDPSLDHSSFKTLLTVESSAHPREQEQRLIKRREQVLDEVAANIRRQPFGAVKAEIVKVLAAYVVKFLRLRDDERWYLDIITMSKRLVFNEMGRRLVEKSVLEGPDDHFFLSKHELYDLVDGQPATRLTRLKIQNRRNVFERFIAHEENPPRYLQDGVVLNFGADGSEGGLQGLGTSRGSATGRARIVPNLKEIGRVKKGDILICNSTDPGWAPVFMVINGLVLETGGMLAHGACLSREYGLPAVQLAGAMRHIEDGAMISVDGDTGLVTLLDPEPAEAAGPTELQDQPSGLQPA